jgi:hypothetical protein
MRSLWRCMAVQWLGGQGSEVLTGDSALLDLLPTAQAVAVFRVTRDRQSRAGAVAAPSVPSAAEREDVEPAARRPD